VWYLQRWRRPACRTFNYYDLTCVGLLFLSAYIVLMIMMIHRLLVLMHCRNNIQPYPNEWTAKTFLTSLLKYNKHTRTLYKPVGDVDLHFTVCGCAPCLIAVQFDKPNIIWQFGGNSGEWKIEDQRLVETLIVYCHQRISKGSMKNLSRDKKIGLSTPTHKIPEAISWITTFSWVTTMSTRCFACVPLQVFHLSTPLVKYFTQRLRVGVP